MIRVQNISKVYPTRFGEKLVLDDISFTLEKGEKLGVLGRNGAGKSTLVRLISGAELPTSGRIDSTMSISWPLAFGGAFQDSLTGVDNVRFISRIYQQDFETNLAFVEDFAELGAYLREEVRTYSSGMRARLAFAISMIIEFDCFLIDEVGAVGDARFHHRCNRELFEKRADRAMVIISHDASYIRDHCDRFGVLHDGKLQEFGEFEAAYADFREKIGLEAAKRPATEKLAADRKKLIETTHTAAVRDEAFRILVQEADWKRDKKQWREAEASYANALKLYPYQRSYWVQKAHCAKEAGAYPRAEAAYRTACALGEPLADVRQHLNFAIKKNASSLKTYPAFAYKGTAAKDEPPGIPDIELLARAAWNVGHLDEDELLGLIREHETCDLLLAHMIQDPRFAGAAGREEAAQGKMVEKGADTPLWAHNLAIIARPGDDEDAKRALARAVSGSSNAWRELMQAKAFEDWSATQAAIRRRQVAEGSAAAKIAANG